VVYFHNVFDEVFHTDENLLTWISVDEAMQQCTPNTSVLIVSDAGAARGNLSKERCEISEKMIVRVQQNTNLLAWLNPMPRDRWVGSSAEVIADQVQMFQLDADGFSSAIDVLQGRGVAS
jgi:uncharacterized protein